MIVTFKSYRTGREWTARFDLGSVYANRLHALKVAWDNNASIIALRRRG